ncbi:MAG: hypothetical protein IKH15_08085 [Bacteroidales bacterium]|nr:hypothetical protein [Bacteroidales bacterium]MBR4637044.1 hypothetical protein [Bacteroidales bacterium]
MRFTIIDNETKRRVGEWADKLVKRIQVEMQNQGLNASGNLSNSLEWEVGDDSVRVLADPYFLYAEGGRRAGKVPVNFSHIIERWISDKKVVRPAKFRTDRDFAWSIVHNIKTYGSSKYRGDRPKDDVLSAPMDELLPELNEIIENRVVFFVNDNLF